MNPKLKDFLEKKKDITIIGFAWSIYWRFTLAAYAIAVAAAVFFAGIEALVG